MKTKREEILKKRLGEIIDELGYTRFFCAVGDESKVTGWMGCKSTRNQDELTKEMTNLLVHAMSDPKNPDDPERKLTRSIITEALLFLAHEEGSIDTRGISP